MNEVIKREKNVGSAGFGYNGGVFYKVTFKNKGCVRLIVKNCNMSCGIKELESVGSFINALKEQQASDEDVVLELRRARTIIKRGNAAHVIASIVVNDENKEIFNLLEKEKEIKIMRPKSNPNSSNKINVIVM